MGFSRFTNQITSSIDLTDQIISNFLGGAGAFGGAQPAWFSTVGVQVTTGTRRAALLESQVAIDPIIPMFADPQQHYRILIDGQIQVVNGKQEVVGLRIYWGTESQLPDVSQLTIDPDTPFLQLWTVNEFPKPFVNPYSYRHTIVERGFALVLYQNIAVNGRNRINTLEAGNTMLVIQRPVDPTTGLVKTTGKLPIFSLDIAPNRPVGEEIHAGVVREVDVNAASPTRPIGMQRYHNLYGFSMMWNHPNILSNLTHVIKVPFGLATDRHLYMQEMDLISFTQASSFISNQEADISMYEDERIYTGTFGPVDYNYPSGTSYGSLPATKRILSGSRLCILTSGGGI